MNEQLQVRCGPTDRIGRRVVIATLGSAEHRDRFDTDSEFHRRKFREKVVEKFGLADDAHDWIEQRIIAAADAEDEPCDGELLTATKPVLVTMADVEARAVDWLWPQRIAAGRLTLLVGRPGDGKSFLTCDMASRISTGTPWPDGTPCPRGSVLFITCEDDPSDTIRPRLDAHRTDVSRVHLLRAVLHTDDDGLQSESLFSLADLDSLEAALEQYGDCRLVVIDPIGSFLGGRTDAHRDNEVRSVLAPLGVVAEKYGVAMLVVCHTRKASSTNADDMVLGSRAFTGIARSVWHLSRDGDDKNRRLLLPGKSNIAAEQDGLAFSIAGEPAAVRWEKTAVTMTADDALAREQGDDGQRSALDEAVRWLTDTLRDGPKPCKVVKDAARADGIANRTLDRAKAKLAVVTGPDGFRGPWVWQLPPTVEQDESATVRQDFAECANVETVAHCGESGALLADSGQKSDSLATACTHCGGTDFRETSAQDGLATRRDCAQCGRTDSFPIWNGEATA